MMTTREVEGQATEVERAAGFGEDRRHQRIGSEVEAATGEETLLPRGLRDHVIGGIAIGDQGRTDLGKNDIAVGVIPVVVGIDGE